MLATTSPTTLDAPSPLRARVVIGLALASVAGQLALIDSGPAGQSDLALWACLLLPVAGWPAFRGGLRGLGQRPIPRVVLVQFTAGTAALGLLGALSAYALRAELEKWFFSLPLFFAPLLGWAVLAAGVRRIRAGSARARETALVGAALLSVPWLFGLWVVYYVTFIDD